MKSSDSRLQAEAGKSWRTLIEVGDYGRVASDAGGYRIPVYEIGRGVDCVNGTGERSVLENETAIPILQNEDSRCPDVEK